MSLTSDERAELEILRQTAAKFMGNPLERSFFELEMILERDYPNRIDSVMSVTAYRIMAKCLLELKRKICDEN